MTTTQPTITLNNGVELSALGFGVFQTIDFLPWGRSIPE